ncbi:MAG: ABC transporter permease [Actinomycetota bacterium]|jgi:ABC-2 type transport system permease protein|nr:ABC transporter permease [Actinomycetota bacterium]
MSTPPAVHDPARRASPPLGGFKVALVRLEVRRLLRNRRTIVFTIVVPVLFFLLFGLNSAYASRAVGRGNVSAFIMISMALYGAVLATSSGGAMVSVERLAGWSRQLRITPLQPAAYIAIKMATSLVLGLAAVLAVYTAGILTHKPSMPAELWVATGAALWIGSLLFAAFGLFVGYLLPSENVMQVIGFALMLFSFGGGLFIPLSQFSHPLRVLATYTPLYGLNELVHYPLVQGAFDWTWTANLVAWLVIFTAGATWRFRKDTARI